MKKFFLVALPVCLAGSLLLAPTARAQGKGGFSNAVSDPLNLTASQKAKKDAIDQKYFALIQNVRKKYKPQSDAVRAKYKPLYAQAREQKLKPEAYTARVIQLQAKMKAEIAPIGKKIEAEQRPLEKQRDQEIMTILDPKQKELFKKLVTTNPK